MKGNLGSGHYVNNCAGGRGAGSHELLEALMNTGGLVICPLLSAGPPLPITRAREGQKGHGQPHLNSDSPLLPSLPHDCSEFKFSHLLPLCLDQGDQRGRWPRDSCCHCPGPTLLPLKPEISASQKKQERKRTVKEQAAAQRPVMEGLLHHRGCPQWAQKWSGRVDGAQGPGQNPGWEVSG